MKISTEKDKDQVPPSEAVFDANKSLGSPKRSAVSDPTAEVSEEEANKSTDDAQKPKEDDHIPGCASPSKRTKLSDPTSEKAQSEKEEPVTVESVSVIVTEKTKSTVSGSPALGHGEKPNEDEVCGKPNGTPMAADSIPSKAGDEALLRPETTNDGHKTSPPSSVDSTKSLLSDKRSDAERTPESAVETTSADRPATDENGEDEDPEADGQTQKHGTKIDIDSEADSKINSETDLKSEDQPAPTENSNLPAAEKETDVSVTGPARSTDVSQEKGADIADADKTETGAPPGTPQALNKMKLDSSVVISVVASSVKSKSPSSVVENLEEPCYVRRSSDEQSEIQSSVAKEGDGEDAGDSKGAAVAVAAARVTPAEADPV